MPAGEDPAVKEEEPEKEVGEEESVGEETEEEPGKEPEEEPEEEPAAGEEGPVFPFLIVNDLLIINNIINNIYYVINQ